MSRIEKVGINNITQVKNNKIEHKKEINESFKWNRTRTY